MSDNGPPQARLGNADYQWGQFDPEAYFQHYYGEPHPDDERVIRCAVAAMKQAPPVDAELDVVDVGTGPSLIPFLCALPRARHLTAWEYADRQYCLAGIGTTPQRDAPPMASLLERRPRGISAGISSFRRSDASPAREKHCQTRLNLRPPRTHMGCGDDVLLCGIHYREARRVRSRMRRLCPLRKARRCFGSSVPRAFGRIYREGKPIPRFATVGRFNPESVCAAC